MAEDPEKVEGSDPQDPLASVDITVALANAGYLFSMFKTNKGVVWDLLFTFEGDKDVLLEVQGDAPWITIVSEPLIPKDRAGALALQVLDLNGRLTLCKAGLDPSGSIIVWTQFPRDVAKPDILKQYIGAVVLAVRRVRSLAEEPTQKPPVS